MQMEQSNNYNQPIIKQCRGLETQILRAYHEVENGKQYDSNIKNKFKQFYKAINGILIKNISVSGGGHGGENIVDKKQQNKGYSIETREVMEKCNKLQKMSDEINNSSAQQIRSINILSNQLKGQFQKLVIKVNDLSDEAKSSSKKGRPTHQSAIQSQIQNINIPSAQFREKIYNVVHTVNGIDHSLTSYLSGVEQMKMQLNQYQCVNKSGLSELHALIKKIDMQRQTHSPPPTRSSSFLRKKSVQENPIIGKVNSAQEMKSKISTLEVQRKDLKERLNKAKNTISQTQFRNKSLKSHIENLTSQLSRLNSIYKETNSSSFGKDQQFTKLRTSLSPKVSKKIPKLINIPKLGITSTQNSNSERGQVKQSIIYKIGKDNQQLKAKVQNSVATNNNQIKFQIRFMSLLQLVRRFLSSLRKVQKTIDNPNQLTKHKQRLQKDKVELQNYLKKHFKYLDKKRRHQLEDLQREIQQKQKEAVKHKSSMDVRHSATHAFPITQADKMITQSKSFKIHSSLDKQLQQPLRDAIFIQTNQNDQNAGPKMEAQPTDDDVLDLVMHRTPPDSTTFAKARFVKQAFVLPAPGQQNQKSQEGPQLIHQTTSASIDSNPVVITMMGGVQQGISGRQSRSSSVEDSGREVMQMVMAEPEPYTRISGKQLNNTVSLNNTSQLKKMADEYKLKNQELAQKLNQYQSEVLERGKTINNLQTKLKQIEQSGEQKQTIKKQNSSKSGAGEKKLKKDLDTLVRQISETNQQVEKLERKNDELSRKLDEVQEQNAELRAIKMSVTTIDGSNAGNTSRVTNQQDALKIQQNLIGKDEIESLMKKLETQILEKMAEMNSLVTSKGKELNQLEKKIKNQSAKLTQLKKSNSEKTSQIESLKKSLATCNSQLSKINQDHRALKIEKENLIAQNLKDLEKIYNQKKAVEIKFKTQDEQFKRLINKNAELEKDKKQFEDEKNVQVKSRENVQKNVIRSQKQCKDAYIQRDKALQKANNYENKMKALENVVNALRDKVQQTDKNAKAVEKNIQLKDKRELQERKILEDQLKESEKKQEDQKVQHQKHITKSEQQNLKLKQIIKTQTSTHKQQLGNAQKKIKDYQKKEGQMKNLLDEQKSLLKLAETKQFKSSQQREEQFNKLIEEKDQKIKQVQKQIEDKKSEYQSLEQRYQFLVNSQKDSQESLNKKINLLNDQIIATQKKQSNLKSDIKKLQERISSLDKQLIEANKNEEILNVKIDELQSTIQSQENEIQVLKKSKTQVEEKDEFNKAAQAMKENQYKKLQKDKEKLIEENETQRQKLKQVENQSIVLAGELEKERKLKIKEQKDLKEHQQAKITQLDKQIAVLKQKQEVNKSQARERERVLADTQELLDKEKHNVKLAKQETKKQRVQKQKAQNRHYEAQERLKQKDKQVWAKQDQVKERCIEIQTLQSKITQQTKEHQAQKSDLLGQIQQLRQTGGEDSKKLSIQCKKLESKLTQREKQLSKAKQAFIQTQAILSTKNDQNKATAALFRQSQQEVKDLKVKLDYLTQDSQKKGRLIKSHERKIEELNNLMLNQNKQQNSKQYDMNKNSKKLKNFTKLKIQQLTQKLKLCANRLFRQRQNHMMLDQDCTQTLNCIKNVATQQIARLQQQKQDLQKMYKTQIMQIKKIEQSNKALVRENEALMNAAKISEQTAKESLKGISAMQDKNTELSDQVTQLEKEKKVLRSENSKLKRDLFDKSRNEDNKVMSSSQSPVKGSRSPQMKLGEGSLSPSKLQRSWTIKSSGRSSSSHKSPQGKRHTIFKAGQTISPEIISKIKREQDSKITLKGVQRIPQIEGDRKDQDEQEFHITKQITVSSPALKDDFSKRVQTIKIVDDQDDFIERADSPNSARSPRESPRIDRDDIKRRFAHFKKVSEKQKEQLAQTNRQLRQEFEIKSDEYAVKMKNKKQRINQMEASVKLISEAVRNHACTIQSITPLTASEASDLKAPDDNQTIQDVLQFAEMRVQKFVAIYRGHYEGGGGNTFRKNRHSIQLGDTDNEKMRDQLARATNKNKMLELEVDQLELKAKNYKNQMEEIQQKIGKNDSEVRRNLENANKKVDKYKELSKQQQSEIKLLKDRISQMKDDMQSNQLKIGVLKHELQQSQTPKETNKVIKDLKKQNIIMLKQLDDMKKTRPYQFDIGGSDTQSLATLSGKSGTVRTPRKCDTDLVLSMLTTSEIKLIQKLVKEDQGGQTWLLIQILVTDLGKDQLPGFMLIRQQDLPGKHYHLLSARVAKKTFKPIDASDRMSPLKAKKRLRQLKDEKHSLIDELKAKPRISDSPRNKDSRQEVLRVRMQRNSWEIQYIQSILRYQKLQEYIEDLSDPTAAATYLKQIKNIQQNIAALKKQNMNLKDKNYELQVTVKAKDKQISRWKEECQNRPAKGANRQYGLPNNQKYSFLDKTFSDNDAQVIMYEFDQLQRRSDCGIVSPILTQNQERLKERIVTLQAIVDEKEEALRNLAKKLKSPAGGGGGDNENENQKSIRSVFYKFITKCSEFDKERQRLIDMIFQSIGYSQHDIQDIQASRGIQVVKWKQKANLLSIYGKKQKKILK